MATYVVTTSNWNQPSFWSGISAASGDTLDLSALGAAYSVDVDLATNMVTISDGVTTFSIGDAGSTGTDAQLGSGSVDFFDGQFGTAGDDTLDGGAGNDSLNGQAGDDSITGGTGDDTLIGGAGDDQLFGQDDGDFFRVEDGFGADTVVGGEGVSAGTDFDTLDLSALTSGVTVTFSGSEAGSASDGTDTLSFSEIEAVRATGYDDTLDGSLSGAALTFLAGAGNDSIRGGDGGDVIDGGAGADTIVGGAGNDSLIGGSAGTGADEISGGEGDDTLVASTGATADILDGGADADLLLISDIATGEMLKGGETVTTGSDNDTLDASGFTATGIEFTFNADEGGYLGDGTNNGTFSGIEHFVLTDQDDTVDASVSSVDLTFDALDGNDSIVAGTGDDSVVGGTGNDTLRGAAGNDTIEGGAGDDLIAGNSGDDSLIGGDGSDSLYGEEGADFVSGGDGDDTVEGNEGNDTLYGGAGNDWMRGSYENDILYGGAGDDYLWGGWGDDTFIIENGFGNDTVDAEGVAETNGDVLDLSAVTDDLTIDLSNLHPEMGAVTDGTSTLVFDEVETIVLGSGANTLKLADGSGADVISGFDGPIDNGDGTYTGQDQLDVSGLTDDWGLPVSVEDVVVSDTNGDGTGDAILNFPSGDTLVLTGLTAAQVSAPEALQAMGIPAFAGDYVVEGTAGDDIIDAGYTGDPDGDHVDDGDAADFSDDDSIEAGAGNDSIVAGAGNDTVNAGEGDDTVLGGDGYDDLYGLEGADSIDGGTGDDTIHAGSGDTAVGGDGDDTFFVSASDVNGAPLTIVGGEAGETTGDTLKIAGSATISMTGAESGTVTWKDGSVLTFSEIENINYVPCFTPGTRLKTLRGEVPVEDIQVGDRLLTRDNGYQPVRWCGAKSLSARQLAGEQAFCPILIRKGALGPGYPERDMMVSPQHRVVMTGAPVELLFGEEEVLAAALHLVGWPGIEQVLPGRGTSYIHFMFDRHELVMSEGLWTESFQPGDLSLAGLDAPQRDELFSLFPELMGDYGREAYVAARPMLRAYQARLLVNA
ncbi:Hint domain-containing protein [Sagittula stellata]|uniref:Type I secretion target repeat protein n=1 Tax=Sagittula stellata (strain ATCC 700073 / DSM 11524 / E-37) TaxID=388399 RepID=A3K5E2_SAGS3|nr:Hint domain-containing protein [Sagittula stellata]EBA07743.1 type I secretion target repeat protein [Sagittula stellata E-37]